MLSVTMLAINKQQLSYNHDQIRPNFSLKNIEFVLLLSFIHFFFFELAVASSGGWTMQGGICWT